MKKRIYKNIIGLSTVVLILGTVIMLSVFYLHLSKQIEQQTIQEGQSISNALDLFSEEEALVYLESFVYDGFLRVTLIEPDGSVLFDNTGDVSEIENHQSRPEVILARKNGTGQDVRMSRTQGSRAYYYAIALDNGKILRVACPTSNSIRIFGSVLPIILACVAVCVVLSFFLARRMTEKIIKPINNMDLQHPNGDHVYDELKPLVLRIKRQNDERSKNEKLRQEFSANVSHELKTPLTTISGYAELMSSGMVSDQDMQRFSEKIYKEAGRMILLVDDIIKISRLDEHRVGIEKETVDLMKMAIDVTDRLELVAEKNRITLKVSGETVKVSAVEQMMDELMYNLCENAVKYNKPGGHVYVTIGHSQGRPMIKVSDNGIGIPKDCQERIFERFFRVDKSHSRQTGGTGLGLAIVKHVVEYHNGEIYLDSNLKEGTTITVLL